MNKFTFEDIFIDDTHNVTKIPKSEYMKNGIIPVIDQSKEYISGYSNNEEGNTIKGEKIIFGDHTRVIKYVDFKAYIGADGVKVLKIKRDDIDCKYMYYYLKKSYIPNTGYNRHFKWLKELKFNIISIEEQRKEVKVLDKIQEIINLRKKQIEKLNYLIKARFIEMFGDVIKNEKNFEYKRIDEISDIVTGTTPDTSNIKNWNGKIRWITPAEIDKDTFIVYDTVRKITEKGRKSKNLNIMPKGTVLFTSRAPIGKTAIAGNEMCCNQGFKNCICNELVNNIYLYSVFKYNYKYFDRLGTGATFRELSKTKFARIQISVPPIKLQDDFADIVKRIDKQKIKLESSLKKMESLQESLMNKYFGGED